MRTVTPSTATSAAATPSSAAGESSGFRSRKTMSYTMPCSTLICVGAIRWDRTVTTCGAFVTPATARAAAVSNCTVPGTNCVDEMASTNADGGAPSSSSSSARARADSSVGRSKPPACSAPGACGASGSASRSTMNQAPITARRCIYMKAPSRSNGGNCRRLLLTRRYRVVLRETRGDRRPEQVIAFGPRRMQRVAT